MTVRVNHDEDRKVYELGDDVEGVFIAFASMPSSAVEGRIAAVQEHAAANAGGAAAPAAGGENAGDYVDNGDGTWTRSSDGATGHFTPAGFTPSASS